MATSLRWIVSVISVVVIRSFKMIDSTYQLSLYMLVIIRTVYIHGVTVMKAPNTEGK